LVPYFDKKTTPPTQTPKGKNKAHHEFMLNLPIGYMYFGFQNSWSPFLAWANGKVRHWSHILIKNNSPCPNPKGKNRAHHECTLSLPIGYMKFLFSKLLVTIFGLD
jgi:hypothetical protein